MRKKSFGTVSGEPGPLFCLQSLELSGAYIPRILHFMAVADTDSPPLILFDGVCNLCAWAVRFIIERDPEAVFRFASLQSDLGKEFLMKHGLDTERLDSFVLIENGVAYTESTAALRVARKLGGAWPVCYAGIMVPKFLRDPAYRFIARNRYRWFGKQDSCLMPTPELRARFLG